MAIQINQLTFANDSLINATRYMPVMTIQNETFNISYLHDGLKFVPYHVGVYGRVDNLGKIVFAKWDGVKWFRFANNIELADEMRQLSVYQNLNWFGLKDESK